MLRPTDRYAPRLRAIGVHAIDGYLNSRRVRRVRRDDSVAIVVEPMITRRVSIIDFMTAARDEIRRLVEQLSDEQVLTVLAEVRRVAEALPEVGWPPPWFGSITTERSDTSARVDEILAEGFGR